MICNKIVKETEQLSSVSPFCEVWMYVCPQIEIK